MNKRVASQTRVGSSQQSIKAQNTALIFNLIRKNTPTSRAKLAKQTGFSPSTVSNLVDELIDRKWVLEIGTGNSINSGRKPIMLEVNSGGAYFVIIEIISGGCISSIYDVCLNKVGSTYIENSEDVGEKLKLLIKSKRFSLYRLNSIHVIFPGLFDPETGFLQFSSVIPEGMLMERDIVAKLKSRFPGVSVKISNDASVLAFMEYISGEYALGTRLLAVNINEGISAGLVYGDSRNETSTCFPLELGHMMINPFGDICKCLNKGCLETECSIIALFKKANIVAGLNLDFTETISPEINNSAMREVARHFIEGSPRVVKIVSEYTFALCRALVNVINMFSVQSIHIGGAILELGDGFMNLIQTMLSSEFHIFCTSGVLVEASTWDADAIRRAAAQMSMEDTFEHMPI
ncbi:MAG: ROK family protein [Oscillospiraceae bacterium]|nr:ROK family protein [Oscillospiraceae bacterium]